MKRSSGSIPERFFTSPLPKVVSVEQAAVFGEMIGVLEEKTVPEPRCDQVGADDRDHQFGSSTRREGSDVVPVGTSRR